MQILLHSAKRSSTISPYSIKHLLTVGVRIISTDLTTLCSYTYIVESQFLNVEKKRKLDQEIEELEKIAGEIAVFDFLFELSRC